MTSKSKIPWTDYTWSPVTGCTPVSEGCEHCYAKRECGRFGDALHAPGVPFSQVVLHPSVLEQPLRWRKPRRVFVCPRADLFHPEVPFEYVAAVFGVMAACPQHTFQVLTKRPARMLEFFEWMSMTASAVKLSPRELCFRYAGRLGVFGSLITDGHWLLSNVMLGVTAENQARADERIPLLMRCPAALRFVSIEPMLGPVDLSTTGYLWGGRDDDTEVDALDWVICGAESGLGRRPMELDWARSLRDQCQAAGVPFFLKQADVGGKLVKMPELDGKIWDEVPR